MVTQVSGGLRVITSTPAKITSVDVRSTTTRPSGDGLMLGQWVTLSKPGEFNAALGEVDFPAVPGPAQIKLFSGGSTVGSVALVVPDAPSASLADCVRNAEMAGDRDVGELAGILEQIRASVGASAEARAGAETAAEDAAGSAVSAGRDAARAEAAAGEAATEAAGLAADAVRLEVKGDADRSAAGAATATEKAAEAAGSATRAETAEAGAVEAEEGAEAGQELSEDAAAVAVAAAVGAAEASSNKADKEYVDAHLAQKADVTEVNLRTVAATTDTYRHVVSDNAGHILVAFHSDGTTDIPGLDMPTGVSPKEKYHHPDGYLAPAFADRTKIDGWGSSTMEGMADNFPLALEGIPAVFTSHAKGGEYIEHNAARMGARPAIIDPVTIPATGVVTVPVNNIPANAMMQPFTGHLGGVHGTLSATSTGFTFTRTTDGDAVEITEPNDFLPDIDPTIRDHTQIMQLGKNNVWAGVGPVIEITDQIMAWLRPLHPRVVLLGHHNNSNWLGPEYDYVRVRVAQMNDHMRFIAGEDCYIDVHAVVTGTEIWDRTGITPTTNDLDMQAQGLLPPSLARDNIHFNDSMDAALAQIIRERIDYLGWY